MIIEPKSARSAIVKRGQMVRIEDLDGTQVGDFVCFNAADHRERLSQAKTRVRNWSVRISVGAQLISNRDNSMFTIVEDTVGVHNIIFSGCHTYAFQNILKVDDRKGCLEHLAAALKPHGLTQDDVPDPLNVFMNAGTNEDGTLYVAKTPSRKGDYLLLRAEMDCLVAMSACPDDHTDANGHQCTRIGLDILDR